MILHFISSEKFVNNAISIFEHAFPNQNHFYVFGNSKLENYKKSFEKIVTKINTNQNWWQNNFFKIGEDDILVFHNLYSLLNIHIATNKSLNKNKKHFIFWGASFYNESKFWDKEIYGELSSKINSNFQFKWQSILLYFKKAYYNNKNQLAHDALWPSISKKKEAFSSIDVVHTNIKTDYLNLISTFKINPKFSFFSYYTMRNDMNLKLGDKILVGNSASLSNNHLEIFDKLKKIKVKKSIICPLSYGDMNYSQKISSIGKNLFRNNFEPLTKFLDPDEYFKIQSQCGVVIMNHYRQQAVGNILTSIYLGAKVFLSNKSVLYNDFKKNGLYIFSIEDDLKTNSDLINLNLHYAEQNKSIIKSQYSLENIISCLQSSFSN